MTSAPKMSRRTALASGIAATTLAVAAKAAAQVPMPPDRGMVPFAAKMRALTGFDPLPRDLLAALYSQMNGTEETLDAVMADTGLPNAAQKRAIRAMYHGILAKDDDRDDDTRLGFSNALQWAAIEDSNNVVSFCGGPPGFWADPPEI